MSGISEDKLDPSKALPLDLAAKLTSVKTIDVKTPLILPSQQTVRGMRVLTTTPGLGGPTVTGSTIIMPSQVLKAAGHQITGLINAGQAAGTALPTNITIQRPAQITIATSLPVVTAQAASQGGATYHVPRGPAVVATLSAPRSSNVGASIRAPLVVRDGSVLSTSLTLGGQQQTSLGSATNIGVQQFSVRPTRTPSPAQNPAAVPASATAAWLTTVTPNAAVITAGNGNIGQQQYGQGHQLGNKAAVQQQQQLLTPMRTTPTSASISLGGASITPAIVAPKGGATVVPAGLVVTRTQPGQQQMIGGGQSQSVGTTLATIRPTMYQPGIGGTTHIPITTQLHPFKPITSTASSSGIAPSHPTNVSTNISIAQVLPNRTQTLVYSGGGPVAPGNQQSFTSAPRLAIGTSSVPFRQTPTPRSVVTATRLAMPQTGGAQAAARVLTAPPGTTVLTSAGVRLSAVAQLQQSPPINTLGGQTLATRGLPLASSQPSTTPSLSNITAIGHLTTLPTSLGGGATLTPALPVSIGGPVGRLTTVTVAPTTAATLSLTNNAHAQQGQTGQIISICGGGQGVRSQTLNLHTLPLVAVTNAPPHHGLSGQGIGPGTAKGLSHQPGAIHLTSMPSTMKTVQNMATTGVRTNVNLSKAAIVAQRQTPAVTTQAQSIPIGMVYPHQGDAPQGITQANVYIHTSLPSGPKRASPGLLSISSDVNVTMGASALTYSIMGNPVIHGAVGTAPVALPPLQTTGAFTMSQITIPTIRPSIYAHNQQVQHAAATLSQQAGPPKLTSSPRPSILRKRDNEGSPLKASKNLTTTLSSIQQQHQVQHLLQQLPPESPRSPHLRPDSRNNGNSSEGGSTTISASSSPGLADTNDDMVSIPMNIIKGEEENRPPPEMSPRKKPRKQNLMGNDFDDHRHDDMQFLNDHRDVKKESSAQVSMDHTQSSLSDQHDPKHTTTNSFNNSSQQHFNQLQQSVKQEHNSDSLTAQSQQQRSGGKTAADRVTSAAATRKPQASLLNSYRQTWKTTNNHYLRYSDVKPKDERRPSIMDLSNQCRVLDKVNGWKIHHLSTQMEDLADQEQAVYNQLTELLKYTESREWNSHDKDVNRINELIKGNLQRIKIINDGMVEAKAQIMKIFDHKTHVIDIISRCASKRNYKKREKV